MSPIRARELETLAFIQEHGGRIEGSPRAFGWQTADGIPVDAAPVYWLRLDGFLQTLYENPPRAVVEVSPKGKEALAERRRA